MPRERPPPLSGGAIRTRRANAPGDSVQFHKLALSFDGSSARVAAARGPLAAIVRFEERARDLST